jgi:hypothetical protein
LAALGHGSRRAGSSEGSVALSLDLPGQKAAVNGASGKAKSDNGVEESHGENGSASFPGRTTRIEGIIEVARRERLG